MKILVTGGAGFVGSHLVDVLVGNHEVVVLDNLEYQVHEGKVPGYLNPRTKYVFADIRDKEILRKTLQDVEVIFHEAAAVGVGQSMYQIEKYVDVNTLGTAKLLEILVNEEHDVKKLIVASSMSIYGEGKYECEECGVVYPKLRPKEQLRAKNWEMKCPNCGKNLKPVVKGKGKMKGEIDRQYLSSQKAKKLLNWEPKYELERGLKETIDWYKKNIFIKYKT